MKKLSRRQFSKLAGTAALVIPVAAPVAAGLGLPDAQQPPATAPAPAPEPKPKLTPEQEEAVKLAIERRDAQLTRLRSRTLAYSLEPAFVFSVRQRPRPAKKAGA